MNFPFLKYSKIYYLASLLILLAAITPIFAFGLNFGIDFTGGSILEIDFEARPENSALQEKIKNLGLGEVILQPTGEKGVILRARDLSEEDHKKLISAIGEVSKVQERRFESIGPVIGRELRDKTLLLVSVSLIALLLYVAIVFKKTYGQISGWQYGLVSIATLLFDVLIPLGIVSLLGKFYNVQFNIPIITAILTILGYTINDKVIVFDRIRENVLKGKGAKLKDVINRSLNETISRSLSTGFCTLLVLSAIFLLGGETLRYFSLTLIAGIVAGTYSSLFIASPVLATWLSRKDGK